MTLPRLSIVIPTHDRAKLVPRAIDSALAQTLAEIEVIVVDDASSDGTPQVVASYDDPRVVYVRRQQSGSAAAARNTGVEHSRAPLVSFLDDDDELLGDFAASMYAAFAAGADDVGLGWCGTVTVQDHEQGETILSSGLWRPEFPDRESAYLSFLASRRIGTNCGITVRRACFERVGGFEERMRKAEDTELLTRMVREFDFIVVPRTLVKIHKHSGPNLTIYDRAMAEAYEVILEKNASTLRAHPHLAAALHYKTGWLHYHGGNRSRAREHMRLSLRRRFFAPKTWLAIALHEILGPVAPMLHRRLSAVASALASSASRARG